MLADAICWIEKRENDCHMWVWPAFLPSDLVQATPRPMAHMSAAAGLDRGGVVDVPTVFTGQRKRAHSPLGGEPQSEHAAQVKRQREEEGQDEEKEVEQLTLPIAGPSKYTYQKGQGGIQRPLQIGSFSYDESRQLHHDDRSRRYYHAPPPRADLNRGFDNLTERDGSINEHLDGLLASIMQMPGAADVLQQAHVITWRGMMTKLCTVLYEDRQGFEMNAMMLGNILYLEEHVGAAKKQDREKQDADPRLKRFGYYGYSFESYTCHANKAHDPRLADPWDGDVNTNVQWCSVVKTKLGADLRLVIGGEVDAVDPRTSAPIEVKTSMQIRSPRDEERFETKLLRFYMQSFLLGVERVVVGFRDTRGVLVTHQDFDTLSMPRAVRGKPHAWDPNACLNFAYELLTTIRKHIKHAMPFDPTAPPIKVRDNSESNTYPTFRIALELPRDANKSKCITVTQLPTPDLDRDAQRVGFLPRKYFDFAANQLAPVNAERYEY